ncbi:GerMN domain-containing protein [Streptomyces sp. NPDC087908]|uniref:GerMN domain-containing protein n=1 Tax=Streptomyces sp. NPDC087908 TaxID=3365820 RepID=UPI0037F77D95
MIEGGEPAYLDSREETTQLVFFISPHGRLTTAPRKANRGPSWLPALPGDAVAQLLAGPSTAERERGLRTALPAGQSIRSASSSPGFVHLTVSFAVGRLHRTAVDQVVCTAAYAEGNLRSTKVQVSGTDEALPTRQCQAGDLPYLP